MRQIYRRISPELSVSGHETRAYVEFHFVRTFHTTDRFTFTNVQLVFCNSIVSFFIAARRHVEMNRKRGKFETQRYDAKDIRYIVVRCNA